MNYEQKHKEDLEAAKGWLAIAKENGNKIAIQILEKFFPELRESEDERIRKVLIELIKGITSWNYFLGISKEQMVSWLEKQGNTNETINRDELAQGVLKGAAINLITWIDYNVAKGNMCLSNMECEDIEDALVSGDWDKIYAYMKKKIEKQGQTFTKKDVDDAYLKGVCDAKHELEKQGEQKPTWSDVDESDLNNIIWLCNNCINGSEITWIPSQATRIKSLIERIKDTIFLQSKQEWSEEDEKMCQDTIDWFEKKVFPYALEHENPARANIKWLKSLKDRVQPNHWKPSEFQLECLAKVIPHRDNEIDNELEYVLTELYEQLKKL